MTVRKIKNRVFELLNKAEEGDRVGQIVDWIITGLIILSVASIIMESFENLAERYDNVFQTVEAVTVIVFTLEYILRIWTADLMYPDAKHPRLKYIFSFLAIIDLLAICPFYLPFLSADLRFLRMMRLSRLLRLMRIFKLGRYLDALQIISQVIRSSVPQLVMSVGICFFVMLFSAIIMYTVENPVQPNQFPNVIASLWWAMCTRTTVGYGDVYPITAVGRFFASVISLVGIGIIAIPTGIIAAGFSRYIKAETGETLCDPAESLDGAPAVPSLDGMPEEDLLILQARVSARLKRYGYQTTITCDPEKAAPQGLPEVPETQGEKGSY